jgi:hypothetical protein
MLIEKTERWALLNRRIRTACTRLAARTPACLIITDRQSQSFRKNPRTDRAGPSGVNLTLDAFHIFPDTRAFSLPLYLTMHDLDVDQVIDSVQSLKKT